jgi:CHAT domain-containing protein
LPLDVLAGSCDPLLSDRPLLYSTQLQLRGNEIANRSVRLPAHTTVIIVASERGVDAMLQVSETGRVVGRADTPVRRTGIQRVVLSTDAPSLYSIAIQGKEHPELIGRVQVRIAALAPSGTNDVCTGIQRLLASADDAYANGQLVTRRAAVNPKFDAPTSYQEAANGYESAARQLADAPPSQLLAQSALAAASVLYYDVEDWAGAISWAEKAQSAYSALGDSYGQARGQALEAASLLQVAPRPEPGSSDSLQSAREILGKARAQLLGLVAFHAQRHEFYDQAQALNNIGITYYLEGRYDTSNLWYQRALTLYARLRERPRQALTLQNMAAVEYELGRVRESVAHYATVLTLVSQHDDPKLYTMLLNNSARANGVAGNYDTALTQYGEALELARGRQDTNDQQWLLYNIGSLYDSIGDRTLALEFYNEALKLTSVEHDALTRMALLRTIGNNLRESGNATAALSMHKEGLALASTALTRDEMLLQIARDLVALKRRDDALGELALILDERTAGDGIVNAQALLERGRIRLSAGDLSGVATDVQSALRTFQTYDSDRDEFDAWIVLAQLKRQTGAIDEASEALDKALALAEQLRVQTANPELRATRLQPLRIAFDLKISLLADQYFSATSNAAVKQHAALEALTTSERARARALEDFRGLNFTAPGVPPELVRERQDIYQDLAGRRVRLQATLEEAGNDDAHVAPIRTAIAELRQRLDQIDARIGAASDVSDTQLTVTAAAPDVTALPAGVAIVEYWLGEREALAWAVTHEGISMVRLGDSARLAATSRDLLTALRGFGTVPRETRLRLGGQLYDYALKPLGAVIAGRRTLLIAPDGALHYVPFAALRADDHGKQAFLVENHDIAVIPSIALLVSGRSATARAPTTREMLLVADPIYTTSDPRLATVTATVSNPARHAATPALPVFRGPTDDGQLARLPGTATEAAEIVAIMPRGDVDRLEGFDATRSRFLAANLGAYRFIHVASHAVADSEVPQASALILSTLDQQSKRIEGRVLAADFMNTRLNADAVVLSSCDTALGRNVLGEGLMGIQYVVLARGARSVVASLWPVADRSASQLMARFYGSLLRSHASSPMALGDAMRAMLSTSSSDPTLWAAFSLTVSTLDGLH